MEPISKAADAGRGEDGARAVLTTRIEDRAHYRTTWRIARWASEEDRRVNRTYTEAEALALFGAAQMTEVQGNILLNEGMNQLWTILCSSGGTKYDNTNAQCGTGTSSTAENPADSALTAAVWKGMMATFPTYGTANKATWKSEFLSAEANQAWAEFSVRNGASADLMLNRKVSAQGTKSSGQVWELTLEITLS
jgi:hypothetical protein